VRNRFLFCVVFLLAASLFPAFAQRSASQPSPTMLFVYEAKDKKIDSWVSLFKEELQARNIKADFYLPSELAGKDLSGYDVVVIYGVVQAFTNLEPIRDWLKTKVDLSGKKVHLFVTANRWYLGKYFDQLKKLLAKKNANLADAVSSATQKLSDSEKNELVKAFIGRIN
jgi:hypothetical protein